MTLSRILARAEQRARQAHNANVTEWYRIATKATAASGRTSTKVYIYDAIGGWFGVSATEFVREINTLEVDEIELHLNSPGGSAFDSIAIHNALKQHDADVHVVVDGLAASGASLIAMAGDTITMATGATMMIHNALTGVYGNAEDMRQFAAVLDKIDESQSSLYASKAGGSRESWREVMRAETWYTADEAVEAGLADRVDDTDAEEAKVSFDLTFFAHAGRSQAPTPKLLGPAGAQKTPAEPPRDTTTTKGPEVDREEFLSALRERLGINADAQADEGTVLTALDEVLAEQATPTTPPGTVLIDQTQMAGLQADAAQGREARQQQLTDQRESLVQAALADGRIAPTSAQDWRDSLAEAPAQSAKILASLAKNTVPVQAAGYTGGVEESNDNDEAALYGRLYPGKEA